MDDVIEESQADVAVVGGGPAGLHAALVLARGGLNVVLLDESDTLGGHYYKRRPAQLAASFGDFRPRGTELIRTVRDAGVDCRTGTLVWGAEDEGRTLFTSDVRTGALGRLRTRATLAATGAYERSLPFPGWTLPGVVTPGSPCTWPPWTGSPWAGGWCSPGPGRSCSRSRAPCWRWARGSRRWSN